MTAARRIHALPAVLAALLMVVALIYRHALIAWFTGAPLERTAPAQAPAAGSATAYYTCSMHPQVHADHPGTCPICSMPLVAVDRAEQATGTIRVDPERRAQLGIRTARAITAPLALEIRAAGRLAVDESRLHDVVLKVGGYVHRLAVRATGQRVARGDVLLTLYSPELYGAQQEYLLARQGRDAAHATGEATRGDALIAAAETRLRLLGLDDDRLAELARAGAPIEHVAFRAPAGGVVIDKAVVEGDAITAGQRLFRIADLDQIWVEADLPEGDLARIARGAAARIAIGALPGKSFSGTVAFVYPYLDPASRTGRVRIALANSDRALKPDMFATVTFAVALGDRLQIPSAAVVYTGPRRLVFVDLGDGRLQPRDVTIGARAGDAVEIVDGLADGDLVVSAGNFLVAAESRIRSTAVDPAPGPAPNTTPGPTPNTAPGPTPNTTPGPTPNTAPGPTPNTAPGPTPGSSAGGDRDR